MSAASATTRLLELAERTGRLASDPPGGTSNGTSNASRPQPDKMAVERTVAILEGIYQARSPQVAGSVDVQRAWKTHGTQLTHHPAQPVRRQALLVGSWLGDPICREQVQSEALGSPAPGGRESAEWHGGRTNEDDGAWRAICLEAVTAAPRTEREQYEFVGHLLGLLDEPQLRGEALRALQSFDDSRIGSAVRERIRAWPTSDRRRAFNLLATRRSTARALVEWVQQGDIALADMAPEVVRQLRWSADQKLEGAIVRLWGPEKRPDREKQVEIDRLQNRLVQSALRQANHIQGKELGARLCLNCHRLYGEGAAIGPDLTGAQRYDLGYLLTNMIDPSRHVSPGYQVTLLELADGRTLSGIVVESQPTHWVLQTATDRMRIDSDRVVSRTQSPHSMMPDGLLESLDDNAIRDLVAYLMADHLRHDSGDQEAPGDE